MNMVEDRYIKWLDIYHYNEKNGMYTAFTVSPVPDSKDSAFVSLRKGMKGEKSENIAVRLSKQEIAYAIMELTKIYNEILE